MEKLKKFEKSMKKVVQLFFLSTIIKAYKEICIGLFKKGV